MLLIYHEAMEYDLMVNNGLDYEETHKETNKKFNYNAKLIEWLEERGEW